MPIIISLFSLLKSYEANKYAEEALSIKKTDHVINEIASNSYLEIENVPDDFLSGVGEGGFFMRDIYRIKNSGGIPATINGFGVRVNYGENSKENICTENPIWGYCAVGGLPEPINRVVVYIVPDYDRNIEPEDLPHDFSSDYPHKLDAYTEEDYIIEISIFTDEEHYKIEYDMEIVGLILYEDQIVELGSMDVCCGMFEYQFIL